MYTKKETIISPQLAKLLDFILYGDIYEAPLNDLNELKPSNIDTLDKEQFVRVAIAASIKEMVLKNTIMLKE